MTDEQKAAYLMAQAAVLMARVAGMQAANKRAEFAQAQGGPAWGPAYDESDFIKLIDESPCHHNAALGVFES